MDVKLKYLNVLLINLLLGFFTSCQDVKIPSNPCIFNGRDTCAIAQNNVVATISLNEEFQTIDNFGASDCWGIKYIGKNWPINKRNEIADLLFSKEFDTDGNPKGIGLSMWRINIGAGSYEQGVNSKIYSSWRREESFLNQDGTYNWEKQAGNRWFAEAAKKRGVENFLLFSISPPVQLTKNNLAFSAGGADTGKLNLKLNAYGDFADFLSEITKKYIDSGIPIKYLSPLNEPQWNWTAGSDGWASQEGTPATNAESFTLVKELAAKLKAKNLATKITFGEVSALEYAYKQAASYADRSDIVNVFWNPSSANYIGNLEQVEKLISAHSYFSQSDLTRLVDNREQLRNRINTVNNGIKFWQTEYCILLGEHNTQGNGRDLGIESALYIARVIHTDLAIGNASAWHWWLGVSPSDYKDGLVYVADVNGNMGESEAVKNDGVIYKSKMLWAFGNYARFIRPGMKRIKVALNTNEGNVEAASKVMISAYKNTTTKEIVTVVINMTPQEETLSLSGISFDTGKLKIYTTSQNKELKFSETTTTKLTIEPRSITTIIGQYK